MMAMRGASMGGMYWDMSLPSFTLISPAAHVALLHTLMYSGFRLPDKIGMNSGIHGWTWTKHAFVRSPGNNKVISVKQTS